MAVNVGQSAAGRHRARPPQRPHFRPDIEGLRAVAVIAVVAFHAGAVSGGFVGVDVFFVISGFLITGLLLRELTATGGVSLSRFYAARARRLLPAAAAVLVVTAAAATALLPPLQARDVLKDGVASALYVGNYRFAGTGTDYLGNTAPSPFQHYWSLGVEEQFYLVWPGLLLAVIWLLGRGWSAARYAAVLAGVVVMSFAVSLTWTHSSPPWAFFALPARAWELAAGGLIAVSVPLWRRLAPAVAMAAGVGGLAMIAIAVVGLGERTPYPGTAALLPVAGTAAVIAAGVSLPTAGAGWLLALPAMRAVGRLSYSWYLWHWPILVLTPIAVGHPLGWAGRVAAVSASVALAVLTLRHVERPIRYSPPLRQSATRSLALGGAVTAMAAVAALLFSLAVPAPVGRGTSAAAVVPPTATQPTGAAVDPVSAAVAAVHAAVEAAAHQSAVPADLSPPLADAAVDKAPIFFDGCVRSWLDVGVPECVSGDPDGATTVALIGDSHAAMWQPALDTVGQQKNWRVVAITKVTCPLQNLPIVSPYLGRDYTECVQWRSEAMDALVASHPRLVVLSMSRRYGADFSFTSYDPAWIAATTTLVNDLRAATGARVLVLGPVPDPHGNVPVCLSGKLDDALACAPKRPDALNINGIAAEAAATAAGGGRYADMSDLFCTAEVCPVVIGRDLVFRDDNHVTVSYANTLAPVLALMAEQALSPAS